MPEPNPDFADMLQILEAQGVRYLIVGGVAFIFHARPRATKDLGLWILPTDENMARLNEALEQFGSPYRFEEADQDKILQLGVAPNRVDLMLDVGGRDFEQAWEARVGAPFGGVEVNWVDLDTLLAIKESIDDPRHREDARVLRRIRRKREEADELGQG